MEKLFHLLRGYVKIRVWGYSPERFINLCGNRDILLWDIERHGAYYTMCISIRGFRQLKPVTKKTKTRVAILQRYGLPFFIPRMRRRSIFILGLLGCLLFLHGMSHFIWAIEITGNKSVTTDVLMDFLEENQIRCGSKKKDLDIESLEKAIRREFDVVTWTSARLDGSRLVIQIKENSRATPQVEETQQEGMDLLADKSGKIVSIITRSGVPMVRTEDEVEAGEMLVSGAVPVYGEDTAVKDYMFCRADADVYLECAYQFEEKLPIAYQCKSYTGKEETIPYLRIGSREFRLSLKKITYDRSDCVVSENRMEVLKDLYFPVAFGNYCYREYDLTEKEYTKEQAKNICQEKLQRIMETLEQKGVQILQKDVKIVKDSRHYVMRANFTVVEKTGVLVSTKTQRPQAADEEQVTEEQ